MKIFAHRGYSGLYPENTMLAFKEVLHTGSYGIELDVQQTKDGQVVIIHDETIDRTTDGKGRVCDFTLEEIQEFNAAKLYKNGSEFHAIPTLEEYCAWVSTTNLITNIELKSNLIYYPNLAQKVIDILNKYQINQKVILSSFNHLNLLEVKTIDPAIVCGALTLEDGLENAGSCVNALGLENYHPAYCSVTKESIAECHAHGIKVFVWTVHSLESLQNCYDWGCDGVFTNYPNICSAFLKSKNKN